MEESSDFTFCQVGSSSDRDNVESPKTIPDISNIKIEDGSPGITKIAERDASSNNSTLKDVGGSVPIFSKSFEFQTPPNKRGRPLDQAANVNGSGKSSEAVRRHAQRAKVPFEKGYSPMDWLKLTRTHPDLAELKGRSNRGLISMDEVRKHKTDGSVWTVLKGRVYNITPYLKFHPGGVDMLMKAAGKDCTALFNKYHAWVNAEFLLEKCLLGFLDDNQ